jgi:hypothetical protein
VRVPQNIEYLIENRVGGGQCLMIPKPQNPKTLFFKKQGPLLVSTCPICMVSTVDLHDQTVFRATEVNDVGSKKMLTTELETIDLARPET